MSGLLPVPPLRSVDTTPDALTVVLEADTEVAAMVLAAAGALQHEDPWALAALLCDRDPADVAVTAVAVLAAVMKTALDEPA
jgi:hypothetical protein